MKVGEVCNRNVIIVERLSSIRDVAVIMREHHVGNVIVVDDNGDQKKPVGILTDRDIVIELIAADVDLDDVNVGDVMSSDLITVREEDDILTMIKKMRSGGVRRVPVINTAGGLEGIVAVDDLLELISEQLADISDLISREQQLEREHRDKL
jgi:predicted transcriptional regulator